MPRSPRSTTAALASTTNPLRFSPFKFLPMKKLNSVLLLVALAIGCASLGHAQNATLTGNATLSPWAAATALPQTTPALLSTKADAMLAVATTAPQLKAAYYLKLNAVVRLSNAAAARTVPVPTGLTVDANEVTMNIARGSGDWTTGATACRALIATTPTNPNYYIQLFNACQQAHTSAHAEAVQAINTYPFAKQVSFAQACWRALDRSQLSKDQLTALINKLLLTVDVTPDSVNFLGMLKSNLEMIQ